MTTASASWRSYLELTKPRILPLVILSGTPPLLMAAGGSVPLIIGTLLGIALAAAAANTLNCYVERERDALMERTRQRPLPAARLVPGRALGFGLALAVVSTVLLWAIAGPAPAGLGVASILFYVFVYTIWLKPRSAWNAVIGGASGAAAPLIADAAVHGHVGAAGLLLFAIIFLWQPPHVWAIALYRKADYARAGIPTLVSVAGDEVARWGMLASTAVLIPVTLAPVAIGLLGGLYLAAAVLLDLWFLWAVVRVVRERTPAAAQRAFHVSLAFLMTLFLAMWVDRLLA